MSIEATLRAIIREEVRAALAELRELPPFAAPSPEWLPIKTCGLRPTTARRLIRAGSIEAARVGREVLVRARDVAGYIESQRVVPHELDEMDRLLQAKRGPRPVRPHRTA